MNAPPKAITGPSTFLDDRLGAGNFLKRNLRKVFPDHWSFLLGEIALYSFVILLLTGTFLTFWFKPSMGEVNYLGNYAPLYDVRMSEAYASSLHISFDVRGGLLVRQMHHWAALLFVAGMTAHALRIFFTGAYRKPRELNWLIGVGLLTLALLEGLTGYSLPDDLLSGAGLRITQGVAQSIPIVGTYISFFLFGGEYPGHDVIPRFYTIHILLIPGILLALISAHMILMWVQKHTQMPGKARTEKNVVGAPFYPAFMAKSGAFFLFTFGVIALLGTFAQINPIWLFGPYNPANISAGSQPDWYMGFLEGALRLMPAWEINFLGHTVTFSVLIPALVPMGIIMTGLALYPFLEQWVTGDRREHHVCDRPRNNPHRTSIGISAITFYGILWLLGANDEISANFHIDLYTTTWFGRFAVFIGPAIAYWITYRTCIGLQRKDAEVLSHGVESGVIKRMPNGQYIEVHTPPAEDIAEHIRGKKEIPVLTGSADGDGIPPKGARSAIGRLRTRMSEAYGTDHVPLTDGHHNGHHEEEPAAVGAGERKELH
ncbi:cytochrome bc complex cytochrome b subunit [Microbispora triticiradicis]|uniref:Cytochrome bc1 complex cytochrome b subunit n=3 Tax=Microbispora TaxID=2005 RepID=A0ABY3LYQ0_9ACTN|nr:MULTISPECIES: cytochrome bc complex cytochrome b subunit [Microbispora]RGA01724.1 cytochrome bc complex cytochrome b subunit [Microbispora triticiradicis]TLP53215.1 cytochrome bc complex cytochrome b subunit [Microbispora fusca]TYB59323.1 cytochrome bc complex cytochrome b subunit [Microbispora tritici]GLW21161.1 cytochrome bc1 complex cytochrome b subunit [Microbispora amethystogenes]